MIFKVLNADATAVYGNGKWHLPKGKRPGKWMPRIKTLEPCRSGYHLIESLEGLLEWLGPVIWIAEGDGQRISKDAHVGVYERARLIRRVTTWNETTARLFAADCAEHVLPMFEKKYPQDDRPRRAIQAARDYARGRITRDEMNVAAWAAENAWAAWAVAWAAARAAERQWQAARLMEYLEITDD